MAEQEFASLVSLKGNPDINNNYLIDPENDSDEYDYPALAHSYDKLGRTQLPQLTQSMNSLELELPASPKPRPSMVFISQYPSTNNEAKEYFESLAKWKEQHPEVIHYVQRAVDEIMDTVIENVQSFPSESPETNIGDVLAPVAEDLDKKEVIKESKSLHSFDSNHSDFRDEFIESPKPSSDDKYLDETKFRCSHLSELETNVHQLLSSSSEPLVLHSYDTQTDLIDNIFSESDLRPENFHKLEKDGSISNGGGSVPSINSPFILSDEEEFFTARSISSNEFSGELQSPPGSPTSNESMDALDALPDESEQHESSSNCNLKLQAASDDSHDSVLTQAKLDTHINLCNEPLVELETPTIDIDISHGSQMNSPTSATETLAESVIESESNSSELDFQGIPPARIVSTDPSTLTPAQLVNALHMNPGESDSSLDHGPTGCFGGIRRRFRQASLNRKLKKASSEEKEKGHSLSRFLLRK